MEIVGGDDNDDGDDDNDDDDDNATVIGLRFLKQRKRALSLSPSI